jgi:hypothetical protein
MNTDKTQHILLIVSAEECGACKYAEKEGIFDKVKTAIKNEKIVRLEHIKLLKLGESITPKYPAVLGNFIAFYPIFILINGKDWDNKLANIDEKNPNIEVFNATITDGKIMPRRDNFVTPAEMPAKIIEWIKTNIESNLKYGKGNIITTAKLPKIAQAQVLVEAKDNETNGDRPKYMPTCAAIKILASSGRKY